jgi:hypothetical protein
MIRVGSWPCSPSRVHGVSVLHSDYRPGDLEWNASRRSWPITRYIRSPDELLWLVHAYAGRRILTYGLNPRPAVLKRDDGKIRSAKGTDITVSQSVLLDTDLLGTASPARGPPLVRYVERVFEYFADHKFNRPVHASTGGGVHFVPAYRPIIIADHPSLGQLRAFKDEFVNLPKRVASNIRLLDSRDRENRRPSDSFQKGNSSGYHWQLQARWREFSGTVNTLIYSGPLSIERNTNKVERGIARFLR